MLLEGKLLGAVSVASRIFWLFNDDPETAGPHTMREMPTNYILLGAFTLAEAVLVPGLGIAWISSARSILQGVPSCSGL